MVFKSNRFQKTIMELTIYLNPMIFILLTTVYKHNQKSKPVKDNI